MVSNPPVRPPRSEFPVISAWSGPGIMISTSAAIANVVVMEESIAPHDRLI
jgi:hypothetical protein